MDGMCAKKEWGDDESDDDLELPEPDDEDPTPDDSGELCPTVDEPDGFELDEDGDGLDFPVGVDATE